MKTATKTATMLRSQLSDFRRINQPLELGEIAGDP
jgi:hypothetical protein